MRWVKCRDDLSRWGADNSWIMIDFFRNMVELQWSSQVTIIYVILKSLNSWILSIFSKEFFAIFCSSTKYVYSHRNSSRMIYVSKYVELLNVLNTH